LSTSIPTRERKECFGEVDLRIITEMSNFEHIRHLYALHERLNIDGAVECVLEVWMTGKGAKNFGAVVLLAEDLAQGWPT
jgi:hypothetical protein